MGDDRRRRILVATRNLLGQQPGGRDITIGSIAAAAHVGRATVYRYFPNKAALLRAATSTNGTQAAPLEPWATTLEAALDLLGERGPHATTLGEIASRAGLSLSGLHWHFKTKDEPFDALTTLEGIAGVRDVALHGSDIHALIDPSQQSADGLARRLFQLGVPVRAVTPAQARAN